MSHNTNQDQQRTCLWDVFEAWSLVKELPGYKMDWEALDALVTHYEIIIDRKYEELMPLLMNWDNRLSEFGNDPTHRDWVGFRPLRLTREEDWSDWLAHLLDSSSTGVFAQCLLDNPVINIPDYAWPKKVHREISHEGFRADIIVEWQDEHFSHIEVKIGDPNLSKTYKTSEALIDKYRVPVENWANFILLLSHQRVSWEQVSVPNSQTTEIVVLTWSDVCIAIRRALLSRELITWKVWAYTFLGAIEQHLIGFPGYLLDKKPSENLDEKIRILQRGLEYEK